MNTHPYFRQVVLQRRPYLRAEWCERVMKDPIAREVQSNGRIRLWGIIPEMKGQVKVLRVVLLPDGETVLNAFPDRDFSGQGSAAEAAEDTG